MAKNRGNIPNMEKTLGPNGEVAEDYIAFTEKYTDTRYVPGDTFSMPGVKEKDGFKLIEAKAEEFSHNDERGDDLYDDYDLQLCITVHADASKYKANENLAKCVRKWLIGKRKIKVVKEELISSNEEYHVGKLVLLMDGYLQDEFIGDITDSEFHENIWKKYMNQLIKEGVCYVKGKVPGVLEQSLRRNIDELAEKTPVDYHPNSNDIVRDLVHPALYSYIKGVSKLKENQKADPSTEDDNEMDFWGRIYEDSKFQWLPTPFKITDDGKCLIQEYINNLDQNMFPKLYEDLQSLFEVFLPYFEETWSYAQAMEFFESKDDDDEVEKVPELDKKPVSFKGQELQIITKIVEYKLQPGQSYEGVWHAEGMSHENIVMTGIYFLDRDENIDGGDLRFKRAFTVAERNRVFWNVPQDRPVVANEFASEGFIPLGYFPTNQGYLLVFPNCHIHKLSKMINSSNSAAASRRIVVFFFVNPNKKIVSTRNVAPQQNVIPLRRAQDYRLELMAERKYDKEKLNVRDIELCEH